MYTTLFFLYIIKVLIIMVIIVFSNVYLHYSFFHNTIKIYTLNNKNTGLKIKYYIKFCVVNFLIFFG